jgi:5-methyltetrahydrofolate--homocysteine methyltransferase
MADFQPIIDALLGLDREAVLNLIKERVDAGEDAQAILDEGLIAGMDIIGEKMENGDMFIPEVLMAAQTMAMGVEILQPHLVEDESTAKGKVIIGTVKGDLHDIGKNLVSMMMESAGLEVTDLGVDAAPAKFIDAIKEKKPKIVGLSALLTTTMPMMKQTVDAIAEAGLRDSVKIMVGGAPVTQKFCDEIGADGYASDAGSASKMAKAML